MLLLSRHGDSLPSRRCRRTPTLVGWRLTRPSARVLAVTDTMSANKILIIEDQAPMRRNLALMLELEGFQVTTAENGRVGVELALKNSPDLVICDVMMPELDGHGVVQ